MISVSVCNYETSYFENEEDFNLWVNEAYERSIINTGINAKFGDDLITLITCCEDFEDARLVVMARKTREGESEAVDTSISALNPKPRYPVRWYTERDRKYPF